MYLFIAHYINMDNNTESSKTIEFDGQFLDSERECYMYAMFKAYELRESNEMFSSLEFIAS